MLDATELGIDVMVDPVTSEIIDEKRLAQQLLEQSGERGVGRAVRGASGIVTMVPSSRSTGSVGCPRSRPSLSVFAPRGSKMRRLWPGRRTCAAEAGRAPSSTA